MAGDLSARLLEAWNLRPQLHVPISLGSARLGLVRRDFAERLRDWPDLFRVSPDGVQIQEKTEDDLTAAFADVATRLAREGLVRGWRNETYAVGSFHVERAAFRFFGFTSSAAHLNGYRDGKVLIARRSGTKAIDPGMLDTLVGGGVPSGQDAWQTLLRECGEEAGIAPELAQRSERKGVLQVCREVPDGVHSEILFVYDLALPEDFAPRNADGEVSEFLSLHADAVLARIAAGELTVEAGLVAADFILRHGLAGFDARTRELLQRCRGVPY